MAPSSTDPPLHRRARRADAERSIAAILDAAPEALASDPEVSMAEIARRAGVARATIYVHFPTREALLAAVTQRAVDEATEALRAAHPEEGDPADALVRVLEATWRTLGRYHALVALNSTLTPEALRKLHQPVLRLLRPLLRRGRQSGAFNPELPLEWMLWILLEITHATSRAVSAGLLPQRKAEGALIASVLGSLSPPPDRSRG